MRRILTLLVGTTMALAAGSAVAARVTIEVHTETPGAEVRARVYALGERPAVDPRLVPRALAEARSGSGRVDLDVADSEPPWRVVVDSPGHVSAAVELLTVPRTALAPLWLPAGKPLAVALPPGAFPAGTTVWGVVESSVPPIPGRWLPTLAPTPADAAGKVTLMAPTAASVTVWAAAPDQRWGSVDVETKGVSAITCPLASRPQKVVVRDARDEPVAGARVVTAESPAESQARTGPDGRAVLQVPRDGSFTLLAEGKGCAGRAFVTTGPVRPELRVICGPPHRLALRWDPRTPTLWVRPIWVPAALRGSTWLPLVGGSSTVPAQPAEGSLEVWAPGKAWARVAVEAELTSLSVALQDAAAVDATVVGPDGQPASAVPVWGWLPPRWAGSSSDRAVTAEWLQRGLLPVAVSGPNGFAEIAGLVPALTRLVARRAGLAGGDSGPFELAPGQRHAVTLTLGEGAWLSVQVADHGGRAVAGALVEVAANPNPRSLSLRFARAARHREVLGSGATDREGRLTLTALPAGPVRLSVTAPGFVRKAVELEVPPGGLDAGVVELEPGSPVSGRVADERGAPVAEADVNLGAMPMLAFAEPVARTDAAGVFVIPDQPRSGELYLAARAEGFAAGQPMRLGLPSPGPVELRLQRGRVLEGLVVDEASTAPVAGARVEASQSQRRSMGGGGMTISFVSTGGGSVTEADGEGRFRLEGLGFGAYDLKARARGFRETTLAVKLAEGEAPRPVTVTLKAGLLLEGVVAGPDGDPAAGVRVQAEPASADQTRREARSAPVSTRTGDDGAFRLEGLAPGRMVLSARGDGGAWGRELAEAGQKHPVELRLEPGGSVQGRVVAESGEPVGTVEVGGWGAAVQQDLGAVRVQGDGTFVVERLAPGRYELWATADGWSRATETATVEPGGRAAVTLTLRRGGTITGRVLGLGSAELERCQVIASGGRTTPAPDGTFTVSGVRLGRTEVAALLIPDGKRRSASVLIEDVGRPATVELDFAKGIALSGSVRRAGAAAVGVGIEVRSGATSGSTASDAQGAWELAGVEPGQIELRLVDQHGRTLLGRRLQASSDQRVDLDLPGGVLRGRVVALPDRRPVAGARVTLVGSAEQPGLSREVSTDETGAFHIEELPDGELSVRARADGYTATEARGHLSMGSGPELTLELQAEQRLILQVRLPDGSAPDRVNLQVLRAGRVEDGVWADCDRNGEAVVTTLPVGGFTGLVWAIGAGQLGAFAVPGGPVPVVLRPTGTLRLVAGGACRVRVVAADSGLVVPVNPWQNPERGAWVRLDGTLAIALPAGPYRVEVGGGGEPVQVLVEPGGEASATVCAP